MAWTTLPTYSAGAVLTAAQMNAIAANINETSAATVTTAGDMTYADAANSMGNRLAIGGNGSVMVSTGSAPVWRAPNADVGDTSYSVTSTSFQSFAVTGSAVSLTRPTGTVAIVTGMCEYVQNSSAGAYGQIGYSVSGASTIAAAVGAGRSSLYESGAANDRGPLIFRHYQSGLTAGSNTFTLECLVSAGTGTFARPYILVEPIS